VAEPIVVELLNSTHDRAAFSCGIEPLDRYLQMRAGQDVRRRVAATYVLRAPQSPAIIGYYTLAASTLRLASLPPDIARRLPRYTGLPALLIGRLAVDQQQQKMGHGARLLVDACLRGLQISERIGAIAMVVDAKDERARGFYERFGFRPLEDQNARLFMPMEAVAKSLQPGAAPLQRNQRE